LQFGSTTVEVISGSMIEAAVVVVVVVMVVRSVAPRSDPAI
jgi:hypothetical protein